MTNTNVLVGGSNVSGNIGSCEIKSDNVSIDYWHYKAIAVNSCTGNIISENIIFDSSGFGWLAGIIILICFLGMIFNINIEE